MITVAVPGGATKSFLELVKRAGKSIDETIRFIVFDTKETIDSGNNWEYRAYPDLNEAVSAAVTSAAQKESHILMKGNIQTHALLKEALKKEHKLKTRPLLSHVAQIHLPALHRDMLLTDSAMNIQPDKERMIHIIQNAVEAAQNSGIPKPKVALLSAAENVNPKMPSSSLADEVTEHFARSTEAIVYGPLSLDLALSKEAVQIKRFEGPIAGDADVLVVPSIDAGNLLYKSMTLFGGATVGGMIVGARVPIVVTSRSDSIDSKLFALTFAIDQLTGRGDEKRYERENSRH